MFLSRTHRLKGIERIRNQLDVARVCCSDDQQRGSPLTSVIRLRWHLVSLCPWDYGLFFYSWLRRFSYTVVNRQPSSVDAVQMPTGKQSILQQAIETPCISAILEGLMRKTWLVYPRGVQSVPVVLYSEDEQYGIHSNTIINVFIVSSERLIAFVLRDKRYHFLSGLIASPLFITCHIFAFRNYQLPHLTIHPWINHKYNNKLH